MVAIFDTQEAADAFAKAQDDALGYPLPGTPPTPRNDDGSPGYGWTLTWDRPTERPDARWAVDVHGIVPPPDGVTLEGMPRSGME